MYNYKMNLEIFQEAAERAFCEISLDDWKNSCQEVMKIEEDYYEMGETLYDDIDSPGLNLQDSSSDKTSESESEMEVEYITQLEDLLKAILFYMFC